MTETDNPLLQLARDRVHTVVDGRWQLESVLGVGGMAAVYAARHRNGKRVAIKLLHPHLAVMPQVVQRFVREGYAANLVEHPGAVSVLDDGVLDGVPFLVMEYLEGETADGRCDRLDGRIALPDALAIADAVLAVLDAGHKKGMVHRDIKPENLFLTSDGEVKVLDFGIARIDELTGLGESSTQSGSSLGTPAFMPPEQARGDRAAVDARTDLWSLGATIFFLVSGKFVHEGGTVAEILVQTMSQRARSLSAVAPRVPLAIVAVVDRALALDPSERWSSAAEMREALRAAAAESNVFVPPRPSPAGFVPPPPPPRSSFASATSYSGQAMPHGRAVPSPRRSGSVPELVETIASPAPLDGADVAAPPPSPSRRGPVVAMVGVAMVVGVIAVLAVQQLGRASGSAAAPPSASSTAAPAPAAPSPPSTSSRAPDESAAAQAPSGAASARGAAGRSAAGLPTRGAPAGGAGRRDIGESRN